MLRSVALAVRAIRFLPAYLALRLMKRLVPIERLGRRQWRTASLMRDRNREARIIADIQRVSRRLGSAARDCVERNLLIYRELSRAGAKPTLVIGLRRSPLGVTGHAWVIADDCVVADSAEHVASFNPIFSFGDGGTLSRAHAQS